MKSNLVKNVKSVCCFINGYTFATVILLFDTWDLVIYIKIHITKL